MPAVSWSPASEGPTTSTRGSLAKRTGRAPYFSELASEVASASVKVPVIWALPSVMMPVKPGLEITLPSRTIAKRPPLLTSLRLMSAKVLRAPPLSLRSTAHAVEFCGMPAEAELREVPSMTALESRNFSPASLQVISGSVGLSTTGGASLPLGGQVNAWYFASHWSPGSSTQASGSSTEAPLLVCAGVGGAVGDAAAVGAVNGDAVGVGLGVESARCGATR